MGGLVSRPQGPHLLWENKPLRIADTSSENDAAALEEALASLPKVFVAREGKNRTHRIRECAELDGSSVLGYLAGGDEVVVITHAMTMSNNGLEVKRLKISAPIEGWISGQNFILAPPTKQRKTYIKVLEEKAFQQKGGAGAEKTSLSYIPWKSEPLDVSASGRLPSEPVPAISQLDTEVISGDYKPWENGPLTKEWESTSIGCRDIESISRASSTEDNTKVKDKIAESNEIVKMCQPSKVYGGYELWNNEPFRSDESFYELEGERKLPRTATFSSNKILREKNHSQTEGSKLGRVGMNTSKALPANDNREELVNAKKGKDGKVATKPISQVDAHVAARVSLSKYKQKELDLKLFDAVLNGNHDEVSRLLVRGAGADGHINGIGYTNLHCACANGHIKIVGLLLKYGASTVAETKIGFTPLHNATANGHVEIVRELIQNGANKKAHDHKGYKPIDYADKKNIKLILR